MYEVLNDGKNTVIRSTLTAEERSTLLACALQLAKTIERLTEVPQERPAPGFNWPSSSVAAKVAAFREAGNLFTAPQGAVLDARPDFVTWSSGAVRRDLIEEADGGCPKRLRLANIVTPVIVPDADWPAVLDQLRGDKLA